MLFRSPIFGLSGIPDIFAGSVYSVYLYGGTLSNNILRKYPVTSENNTETMTETEERNLSKRDQREEKESKGTDMTSERKLNEIKKILIKPLHRKRAKIPKILKESRSWTRSSHPKIIELTNDSLEVVFFDQIENSDDNDENDNENDDDNNDNSNNNGIDENIKTSSFIFIDETRGSVYWMNVFSELKSRRLSSSQRKVLMMHIENIIEKKLAEAEKKDKK